jgi:predicted RNase H-like HicB family nuclease
MRNYIGLIHKDADSDFGVSFPDFPGVVTAGKSLDDARAMAEEALAFHIEGMVEDGEAVPEPSSLEDVMADPDNRDGVVILVGVKTDTRKAVRVNVTLPEDVLEQIDQFAEAHGYTRSGFLARAAKHAIEQPEIEHVLTGAHLMKRAAANLGGARGIAPRSRKIGTLRVAARTPRKRRG